MVYENHPENPKVFCVILHGMGEHARRYTPLLNAFEKAEIKGVVFDLPYHGEIEEAGLFESISVDEYLNKIHQIIEPIKKQYPSIPHVMLGHSMGSLISRRYAQVYPDEFKSMIWMGTMPLYSKAFTFTMRFVATFLSAFVPFKKRHTLLAGLMNQSLNKKMPKNSSKFSWLSYNLDNVKTYEDDPYCGYAYNGTFYRFFFKLMHQTNFNQELKKTTLRNVLLISGEDDPVTGSKDTFDKLIMRYQTINPNITFETVLMNAMRHEILHEKESTKVTNLLIKRVING